ncbi:glutaredoxin 3 [Agaribacterium haliotis]|uniref:glutaredoxin 3 n=1 Tax=Agaribacterium haliotis TaxID=2013869 RepID=UPI000BB57730|nr:glutaredoxin 3 [Agaribacterium haliotis]
MAKIKIFTTRFCPYCVRAKQLLKQKGQQFDETAVDGDRAARQRLYKKTGSPTVPQIWIGASYVGGCDELYALERAGKLDQLLAAELT